MHTHYVILCTDKLMILMRQVKPNKIDISSNARRLIENAQKCFRYIDVNNTFLSHNKPQTKNCSVGNNVMDIDISRAERRMLFLHALMEKFQELISMVHFYFTAGCPERQ